MSYHDFFWYGKFDRSSGGDAKLPEEAKARFAAAG